MNCDKNITEHIMEKNLIKMIYCIKATISDCWKVALITALIVVKNMIQQ